MAPVMTTSKMNLRAVFTSSTMPELPQQHQTRVHARGSISHRAIASVAQHGSSPPSSPAPLQLSRRAPLALLLALGFTSLQEPSPAQALGFKKELKKRKIPAEEYGELPDGLKFYDLSVGNGDVAKAGSTVTVHFDCMYRGIDVVSSRSARLLGGNRTVAEPFQFVVGESVSVKRKMAGESAGGLFAGGGGPKPPPALSTAVVGMKVGGKRSILVPPELGYGDVGEQEIGPGQSFELKIELLAVE